MKEGEVKFEGSVVVAAQRLRVAYEIENRSGQDIYVFDAMFRFMRGQPVLDSTMVYTVLERDLITLFRGVLRIPEGLQVEAPDLPFARLLPAGGKLTSTIDAPVPLRFHNPYDWHDREENRSFRKIRFRIGYVATKEIYPQPAAKTVSDVTVYPLAYRQAINVESFLETPVQDVEVTVHVRP